MSSNIFSLDQERKDEVEEGEEPSKGEREEGSEKLSLMVGSQ